MSGTDNILRFGVFEANLQTGELRKRGVKVRLQEQPFQILVTLLSRPGELVTREELVKQIWPQDTFVDFDHSLNTAVNKLREVLGDSANSPRFIETLPKRGYRFVGSVETKSDGGLRSVSKNETPIQTPVVPQPSSDELPPVSRGLVRSLFLLAQIMYLGFYIALLANFVRVHELLEGAFGGAANWIAGAAFVTSLVGIPIRFFLITAVGFDYQQFRSKYDRLFHVLLLLDEFWGLSPLLMAPKIGFGLALATVAALLYLPFGQRTLVQMAFRKSSHAL